MIPKNDPPRLQDNYSEKFQDFVSKCLEMKQSLRWDATQLLQHQFIKSSKLERNFAAPICTTRNQQFKTTIENTIKAGKLYHKESDTDEWDFSAPTQSPVLKKIEIPKALGKSVVFEDEFESKFPEQKYSDSGPFGAELLKSIVIPAFSSQTATVGQEGKACIERISVHLKNFAQLEPQAAENACRNLLESLLCTDRQSLREFVASVTVKNEMEYFNDFEESEHHKLNFYISCEQQEIPAPIQPAHQSRVAEKLFLRWIKR